IGRAVRARSCYDTQAPIARAHSLVRRALKCEPSSGWSNPMTADGSLSKSRPPISAGNGATMATLATRLAQKICAFAPEDVAARALNEARTAIIDTVGCALAGGPEPCVQILLKTPGVADAPGPALLFGTS